MEFDFKNVVENIFDGLYLTDKDRRIIFWNREAERITGYSAEEVIGSHCWDNILVHVDAQGCSLCRGNCPLTRAIRDGAVHDAEIFLRHKDGHRVPVWVRSAPLKDTLGNIAGGAELFTDLSGSNAISQKLRELRTLSFVDELTQLANRRFVTTELLSHLAERIRYQLSFGILMIDIDGFKPINDTYGHAVGDQLLCAIARTMLHVARPFDVFGRWGGDEFLGIIRSVDRDGLLQVASRLRALVAATQVQHPGGMLHATVSIGGCLTQASDTLESLTRRADELLYRSKQNGRNCLTVES